MAKNDGDHTYSVSEAVVESLVKYEIKKTPDGVRPKKEFILED